MQAHRTLELAAAEGDKAAQKLLQLRRWEIRNVESCRKEALEMNFRIVP